MTSKSIKKSGLFVLALIIALVGLTACGKSSDNSNKAVEVNIAVNGGLNLLSIAKSKGWFEEEFATLNATVNWHEFQSSVPLLEGLVSDRIDFSFIGDGTVVTGKAAKTPFTVISATGVEGNQNSILVKPDSDIQSIADLKGKQIALAKGSSAHIFLVKALEKNGMSESDVKIVQLQPDEANAAFQAGQVDAWGTWDPYVTIETSADRARIVESVKTMNFVAPAVMIGRDKFLKENPELAAAYLRVYQKAVDWVKENTDEAAEILATERKMDKTLVKTLLENTNYINEPITDDIASAIQTTADILFATGTVTTQLDVNSNVFDNSYYEASKK
ncbi:aliphatic sulfonate ABC transporter substrate-binding protein [Paenibacillus endoradicis]|uniref:aliphatic sulfonate ABC transporter substrate-binding protein n=1 Tax=Paenibacillus endoradicis TaxID=2972487 RepID=UPI002158DB9B|nr:aliphatic sulfonate ABC transporter substrate-binding protein [Paenibacillus endoradicis]MCR8659470.1 aliphatic sulfonate ABC transporter substrate-binding protein [Paenibacillus endoradicis]